MTPPLERLVVLSTSVFLLRSTERLKWWRKSAPSIGLWTSATTKIHGSDHLNPRLRVRDFLPKVMMGEPFIAWRLKSGCGWFLSVGEGGNTLIAAPVSTRNVRLFVRSVR